MLVEAQEMGLRGKQARYPTLWEVQRPLRKTGGSKLWPQSFPGGQRTTCFF